MKVHVLQIRLNPKEYAFLKRCANTLGKNMSQTMLYLADFHLRMDEENQPPKEDGVTIKGIPFSEQPFEDYEF